MKVSFVPYRREFKHIGKEILNAIKRCVKNGDFVYRKDIIQFEKNLAKLTHTKYAISTDSCTGAMFIALKALGIGPGDEVITVAHTYIATIDVIVHSGAKPILVDIGYDFNIDPGKIEATITKRTKAILVVHLNGRMAQMDRITSIAKKHSLLIVEDAAQALGATYQGKPAGSWGIAGCFSFYPAKVLGSYGEGGAVVTSNKKLADKLFYLRDHGEAPSYRPEKNKTIHLWGYNTIMDNVQAAILNVKLKYLKSWIEKRRLNALEYATRLKDPAYMPVYGSEDVFQNVVILVPYRDRLQKFLKNKGIETLVSWKIPNHKQESLKELHRFELPMTEFASESVLSLPCHPYLTGPEVDYVIKSVNEFYD